MGASGILEAMWGFSDMRANVLGEKLEGLKSKFGVNSEDEYKGVGNGSS